MNERIQPLDLTPGGIPRPEPVRLNTAEIIKPLIEQANTSDVTMIETRRAGLSYSRPGTILARYRDLFAGSTFRVGSADLAALAKESDSIARELGVSHLDILSVLSQTEPGVEGNVVDQGAVNKAIVDINIRLNNEYGIDGQRPVNTSYVHLATSEIMNGNFNSPAINAELTQHENRVNITSKSQGQQPLRQSGGSNQNQELAQAMALDITTKRETSTSGFKLMLDSTVNRMNYLSDKLFWEAKDFHIRYEVVPVYDKNDTSTGVQKVPISYKVESRPIKKKLTFELLSPLLQAEIFQRAKEREARDEGGSIKRAAIIQTLSTGREGGIGGVVPGKERSFYYAYIQLLALHQRGLINPDNWSEADAITIHQLEKLFAESIIPFTPEIRGSGETSGIKQIRENTFSMVKSGLSQRIDVKDGKASLVGQATAEQPVTVFYAEESTDIWRAGELANEVLQECGIALRLIEGFNEAPADNSDPKAKIESKLKSVASSWLASPSHASGLFEAIFEANFFSLLQSYHDLEASGSASNGSLSPDQPTSIPDDQSINSLGPGYEVIDDLLGKVDAISELKLDQPNSTQSPKPSTETVLTKKISRKALRDLCNEKFFKGLGFTVNYDPIFSRYTITTLEDQNNSGIVKFVSTGVPENGLFSKDQVPNAIRDVVSVGSKAEIFFALGIHLADATLKSQRPDANQVELALRRTKIKPSQLAANYLDTNPNRRLLGGDPTTATMAELIHSIREAEAWKEVKAKTKKGITVVKLTFDSDPYGIGSTAIAMGLASLQKTRPAAESKASSAERNQNLARANKSADAIGTPRLYSNDLKAAPFDATLPRENEPMVVVTELTKKGEHRSRLAYRDIKPINSGSKSGTETTTTTPAIRSDMLKLKVPGTGTVIETQNTGISVKRSPEVKSFLAEDGLYRLATRHLAEVGNIARYAGEPRFAPEDLRDVREIRLQQYGVLARCYATVAIRTQRDLDYAYARWQQSFKAKESQGLSNAEQSSSDPSEQEKQKARLDRQKQIADELPKWSKLLVDIAEKRVMSLSTHFDRDEIYKIGADRADDVDQGLLAPNAFTGLDFADDSKDHLQELYPLYNPASALLNDPEVSAVIDRAPEGSPTLGKNLLSPYEDGASQAEILADTLNNEQLTDLEFFQRLVEQHINSTPRIRSQARKARYFWLLEMKLKISMSDAAIPLFSKLFILSEYLNTDRKSIAGPEKFDEIVKEISEAIDTAKKEAPYSGELEEMKIIIGKLRENLPVALLRVGRTATLTTLIEKLEKVVPIAATELSTREAVLTTRRDRYFELVAEYAREATVNRLLGEQLANIKENKLTAREVAEKILSYYLQALMAEYINLGHNIAQEINPDDVGNIEKIHQNRSGARLAEAWGRFKLRWSNPKGYYNTRAVPTAETIATHFSQKNFLQIIDNTAQLMAIAINSASTQQGTPEHIRPQVEKVLKMAAPEYRPAIGNTQRLGRSQDVNLQMLLEQLLIELIKDDLADNGDRLVLGGLPAQGHLVPGVERAVNLVGRHYEGHLLDPRAIFPDAEEANLSTIADAKTPPPVVTGRNQSQVSMLDDALELKLKNGPEAARINPERIPLDKLFPYMAKLLVELVNFEKRATRIGTRAIPSRNLPT